MVEKFWWNSGTVMLEQCTWNSNGGILRSNSVGERVMVKQCGGTVEQWLWNSGTGEQ